MSLSARSSQKLLVVALVALAVGLGIVAQRQLVDERHETAGLMLWAIAIGAFLLGLWLAARRGESLETPAGAGSSPDRALPLTLEAALFAAVMAVGVFFRFYRITTIPPGLNHDAALNGLYAIRITHGIPYTPYMTVGWGQETMFHYVIAFFQVLLGPTEFALELAAIVVGILTLPAFYLLMRRLFDARPALVATFLLAVSGWHITFSRVAWRGILLPLFASLVFYFVARAFREKRLRDFVLAGIFLGLTLDTYSPATTLPFAVAAYIAYELIRQPSLLRTHYRQLGLFGLAAVLAFSPLGWYAMTHWHEYTQRSHHLWLGSQITTAGDIDPLFTNIKNGLLMFNFRANGNDFFIEQPLLDMPVSVFFTLGLVYGITRWRQPSYFLLLVFLLFTVAAGVAVAPNGNRCIAAVLPASAFAALFLCEAWRWLRDSYPRYTHVFAIVLIFALLYAGYTTYDSYLGPARRDQFGYDEEATIVGRYMHDIGAGYDLYAAAGNWPAYTLMYTTYPGHGDPLTPIYKYTKVASDLLTVQPPSDRGLAFVIKIHPAGKDVRDILIDRFPAAKTSLIAAKAPAKRNIAYVLLIPPRGGAGADLSSYIPAGADKRDARRRLDLDKIAGALLDLRRRDGHVPSTDGAVGVGCAYGKLGRLCPLTQQLGEDIFTDPRGSPLQFGYWYKSDGSSFTLYASFEAFAPPARACRDRALVDKPNLYCLPG